MLGVRHYKDIAFDLWLGELKDFFSDKLCIIQSNEKELSKELEEVTSLTKVFYAKSSHTINSSLQEDTLVLLKECKKDNIRHLSIYIKIENTKEYIQNILHTLKEQIDKDLYPKNIKRISFIADDKEYYNIQEDFLLNFFQDTP